MFEEIEGDMKAGRELDMAIAEKVMGLEVGIIAGNIKAKVPGSCGTHECTRHWVDTPHYSTDIAAAWQVIEKMYGLGWDMSFELFKNNNEKPECRVEFARIEHQQIGFMQFSDTISQAVCLAALEAIKL